MGCVEIWWKGKVSLSSHNSKTSQNSYTGRLTQNYEVLYCIGSLFKSVAFLHAMNPDLQNLSVALLSIDGSDFVLQKRTSHSKV